MLKFVSTAEPTPQNASTAPRRGTDNNSRASKAQGDASSRENGREGVQTDSGVVRGGLCFFYIFWQLFCISRFLRRHFETTESCKAATPNRFFQAVNLAARLKRTLYIYYRSFSSLNSRGKSLKSNKTPLSSLAETVKLWKCLPPHSASRN